MKRSIFAALLALGCTAAVSAEVNRLVIEPNAKGARIPSTMYGLFFEDINYAADGGLYAEKIKNRSFDFPQPLMGWNAFGKVEVRNDGPFERNPNYVRLSPAGHSDKHTGLDNEGFFGVSFAKGENYRFSVWARVPDGGKSKIRVELEDPASMGERQEMAVAEIEVSGKEWKKYTATLSPKETVEKGKLRIFLNKPETTLTSSTCRFSPKTRGTVMRTVSAKILPRNSPTSSRECSASPAVASWKAPILPRATSGKTR